MTPRAFAAQMRWLALGRYSPITLDTLLRARGGRGTLPGRPVVITFDDGFQDCATYAVPILRARGFTAMFYLVAGLMGQTSRWLVPERGLALPLMDWATARQLRDAGFSCGAHTMTHPHLADLSSPACRDELLLSRRLLEDRLGREVTHLAYPYGSYNSTVRALAAETGYTSACSVRIGLSPAGDDPLALHRVPITGQDSLLDFVCKLRTAGTASQVLWGAATAARRRLTGGYAAR